jgi:thiamine-monophosphate kinase
MFTSVKEESILSLGEVELITSIKDWLREISPPCPQGIGDDCAIIDTSQINQQLLTTDSISYGCHFDHTVSAKQAGAKLINRNLSDIAAMGGHPGSALLNLLCGSNLRIDWLRDFIEGIRQTCKTYSISLIGGDISTLPAGQFTAALSLTGHLEGPPLLRRGALAGDAIYVTGTLGGSIYQKHYSFEPHLAQGQWLAQSKFCSAMMDISDGLAKDLKALILDGCAAHINLESLPVSPDAHRRASESGQTAQAHAFCDGEDYELLFTVKRTVDLSQFIRRWSEQFPTLPVSKIGELRKTDTKAHYINSKTKEPLPWLKAFEHFTE